LAAETPATLIVFDLLVDERRKLLAGSTLKQRRPALETFSRFFDSDLLRLSPATLDIREPTRWLQTSGATLDGVIAKRTDVPYASGERTGTKAFEAMRAKFPLHITSASRRKKSRRRLTTSAR